MCEPETTYLRIAKVKLAQAEFQERQWRKRLMVDGDKPQYQDCCDYSDGLVTQSRFGTLSRLEWMLRVVVGYSRRQDAYIKKLEAACQKWIDE